MLGDTIDRDKIAKVVTACGDRLKIYADVLNYGAFFFRDPQYDAKAVKQRLHKEGIAEGLREFAEVLKATEPFDVPTLEAKLHAFSDSQADEGRRSEPCAARRDHRRHDRAGRLRVPGDLRQG